MASKFDDSDFIDGDFQDTLTADPAGSAPTPTSSPFSHRPPTREELDQKVSDAQQRLAELRRAQEQLERERAALEEGRRRRIELKRGREEVLEQLTRGVTLLEQREFAVRREAEQMVRSLSGLREVLAKVHEIREEEWTHENWQSELTKALTFVDNARMEWNGARLKWPFLDGALTEPKDEEKTEGASPRGWLDGKSFWQICKVGAALTWPLALIALAGFGAVVYALLSR